MSQVVVVGAGHWGKNVVRTLYTLGALAGVVESDPERRLALAQEYPGVPVYDHIDSVLSSDVSALAIATPAPTHYSLAGQALAAGKDVFVEKPITLRVDEARALNQLASERRRILMVGHMLLYQPAVQRIKELIDSQEIGELWSLHQERLGFGIVRRAENALWSLGVHDVAVALYLFGEPPIHLWAAGQRVLQESIEDDVHLHMRFSGNREGHLHVSWLWPHRRRRMTVIGSNGMIVYDELDQTVTLYRKGFGDNLEAWDEGEQLVAHGHPEPLRFELQHFLHRIEDRQPPLTDGNHAIQVMEVLERASNSLTRSGAHA